MAEKTVLVYPVLKTSCEEKSYPKKANSDKFTIHITPPGIKSKTVPNVDIVHNNTQKREKSAKITDIVQFIKENSRILKSLCIHIEGLKDGCVSVSA